MSMTMRLFSCGGFGLNVAAQLLKFEGKKNGGYAEFDICFIDTSRSNLIGKDVPEEKLYILDSVDGSGKKRSQNYEVLSESAKDILHRHKPGDVNIVLHSASGG